MGKTTASVDTLDRLAVQLSGIQEAAKQLREIGSYDGAIEELKKQKETLLKEIEVERTTLSELQKTIQASIANAQHEVDEIRNTAASIIDDAKRQATKIVQDAEAKAVQRAATERTKREGDLSGIQKQIDEETIKLNGMKAKTAQALAKIDAIEKRAQDAQQALESIQNAVKAQAKALAE
jgi:chromosome segregation ATPase